MKHFYTVKIISGRSMQPTLNPEPCIWRDVVVFDRVSVQSIGKFARGEVVALRSPTNPSDLLVKRIVALEGDVVQTLPPYPEQEVKVPPGHVWLEGDEGFRTIDSNRWGPVPLGLIDSKLTFIIWPPPRFGPLPTPLQRKTGTEEGRVWRRGFVEMDREKWRDSRVKKAGESLTRTSA